MQLERRLWPAVSHDSVLETRQPFAHRQDVFVGPDGDLRITVDAGTVKCSLHDWSDAANLPEVVANRFRLGAGRAYERGFVRRDRCISWRFRDAGFRDVEFRAKLQEECLYFHHPLSKRGAVCFRLGELLAGRVQLLKGIFGLGAGGVPTILRGLEGRF